MQVPCLTNGTATTFDLFNLRGKFVLLLFQVNSLVHLVFKFALLLFQPVDFGYVGPTELELLDGLGADCEVKTFTQFSSKIVFGAIVSPNW